MDRLKFNNLVITNKKVIQKARAQTIAKLVQKLRKTKDVLAKNPDSEKEKIRLRKNSECLSQLKTLKCLDIVRQSLLQEGTNPNVVIANERSTPDELGIAMLRLNKLMHGLVDTFVETLKLGTEKEAKWREEILETSKRRVKIERTEERKRKRKELKEQKALTKNRLEWLEQNKVGGSEVEGAAAEDTSNLEVSQEDQQDISNSDSLEVSQADKHEILSPQTKPEKPQALAKEKKEPLTKKEKNLKKEKPIVTKDEQLKPEKTKKETVKTVQENQANSQHKQQQQEIKTKEPKPKPLERKPAKEQKPRPKPEQQLSIEEEEPKPDHNRPTHVVDPFFITESGQPYMSTAVVLSGDNDSEAEEEQRPPPVKRFRNEERRTNTGWERPERQQEFKAKKPTDDRHPSWLAKQLQKPIISDFKGKKITFGEDGQADRIITPSNNPPASTAAPSSTEGMHPSWVAKQKFKPKIAAFQGTKIKFDED
ncbi:DNA ligase 1 [Drosophila rhopaloa]|uniref:Serum response factor-binding protein 1 n=1 Tax=Drosophila rhopaloa TaxID=1041015 RepID=A0ABM5J748_DRORH|nr:DNA ligase 1 [Drosophila rhopaloa]